MNKLNVLYITGIPSPYRVNLFNEMGRKLNLTVLFQARNQTEREDSWIGENIHHFQPVYLNDGKLKNKFDFSVIKYLNENHNCFDLIIFHGYSRMNIISAIFWMKLNKLQYILEVDGGFVPSSESIFKKMIKTFCIKNANFCLSTGCETTNFLKFYGAKEENIFYYPFTSLFESEIKPNIIINNKQKAEIRNKLNIQEGDFIILSVGQFIHRKGFDILIKAFEIAKKEIPEIKLFIIGGNATEEYLDIIKKSSIKDVYFFPFTDKNVLSEYYLASDLFILATREDIWGLVINEALGHGIPTLTTNRCIAGLEMLPPECIFPVESIDVLAAKIVKLYKNPDLLEELKEKAIGISYKYTIEKSAIVHEEIFYDIIKSKI